jgi:3-hydroxyacyl-CoA dehydrogenase/enoyl-CoA hydratase/3-hydroxybutyryl-CoA epimerase
MQQNLELTQFRVETTPQGIVHLIFDMPGRSMNVFSNAAIKDLGDFAAWVKCRDARGVVVRSGKTSAFCAGADLIELGQAYDMIMAAPPAERFKLAFDHFFQLSAAVRALETCGKPVATAIAGLALGGGCELALGTHYRVLVNSPKVAMGLPESLVGLLPGAGGTQRMPRVVGLEKTLPILLTGGRLSGQDALDAGLASELVAPGEEVAAAERWILSNPVAHQPWDDANWKHPDVARLGGLIAATRSKILAETLGHYPAPLAILECLEQGFPQDIETAIRTEMTIFAGLIQRPEARDMIRTMFIAKTEYERKVKAGDMPAAVTRALRELPAVWQGRPADVTAALVAAGFRIAGVAPPAPDADFNGKDYWYASAPVTAAKRAVREVLEDVTAATARLLPELGAEGQRLADYGLVSEAGFPAYLGGPFCLLAHAEKIPA